MLAVTAMKVNINLTPKSNYSQAVIFNSSRAEVGKAQAIPKRTGSVEEGEIRHPNSCQSLSSLQYYLLNANRTNHFFPHQVKIAKENIYWSCNDRAMVFKSMDLREINSPCLSTMTAIMLSSDR